ncbi:glycosyltransferase [Acidithrix sp. C25]|uniref:glycosyltransferase n=1 Tax=Acidithrix sp. C25 TaxID=1671482 RepID=UPI00191BC564|nr:glycosyltransferase [Acidithrix sp. C25]CAG4903414.1 unnamed protein product [Acidithrix sp. C25]
MINRLWDSYNFSLRECELVGPNLISVPARIALKLSEAGTFVIKRALESPISISTPGEIRLFERLQNFGLVAVSPMPSKQLKARDTSVIIPCFDPPDRLRNTLKCAKELRCALEIIVVDDGSCFVSENRAISEQFGAKFIALDKNYGPARARNAGAAKASGSLLLFLDCALSFDSSLDETVALVLPGLIEIAAPRIRTLDSWDTAPGRSIKKLIDNYESTNSALDLGEREGFVGSKRSCSYLPSTAIAIVKETFCALGGFDESMRLGEDVDLIKRALLDQRTIYYNAKNTVSHPSRDSLISLCKQRFGYGRSSGPLAKLYGRQISHEVVDEFALISMFAPLLGEALRAAAVCLDRRRTIKLLNINTRPNSKELIDISMVEMRRSTKNIIRSRGTFLLIGSLVSPRLRQWSIKIAVLYGISNLWVNKKNNHKISLLAISVLDDISYSMGVVAGMVTAQTPTAIKPTFNLSFSKSLAKAAKAKAALYLNSIKS